MEVRVKRLAGSAGLAQVGGGVGLGSGVAVGVGDGVGVTWQRGEEAFAVTERAC